MNKYELLFKTKINNEQLQLFKAADSSSALVETNGEHTLVCSPTKLEETTTIAKSIGLEYKIIGSPDALVCIFEFFKGTLGWPEKNSKGLARVFPVENCKLMVDATMSGLKAGTYQAAVHEFGDLSRGVESCGKIVQELGTFKTDDGKANFKKTFDGEIWQWVGKSICVHGDGESICGILARSAGAFENKKRVCDCTGRTIWED